MLPKIDPKSLKNGPWGASRGVPGAFRNPVSRKSPKKNEKSRENYEKWASQNACFFVFRVFLALKTSYKNAIVANERFSTRFGHRTHFGTLRASVLRSFCGQKWDFFGRKNGQRKIYDFFAFRRHFFQKPGRTKKTKSA